VLADFADWSQLSTADFLRRSVSIELLPEPSGLIAQAYAPSFDGSTVGPAVPELVRRLPAAATPREVGEVVVDLFSGLRATA
jgi:hypothetical protein